MKLNLDLISLKNFYVCYQATYLTEKFICIDHYSDEVIRGVKQNKLP